MVSVVIPVYNVEKYLRNCIESVLRQTYEDIEIILVDDGSPDRSGEISDEYAARDSRISVVHKTHNEGLNMARATGYEVSTGEFVTFVDSDDGISPEYIEKLVKAQTETDADITMCGYLFYDSELEEPLKKQPITQFPVQEMPSLYTKNQMIHYYLTQWQYWKHNNNTSTTWCKLFKRELLGYVKWRETDYNVGEDDFETLYTLAHGEKFAVINDQLYLYRANPDSISNSNKFTPKYRGKNISAFDMCRDFEKKALDILGENHKNEILFRLYTMYQYYISLLVHKNSLRLSDISSFDKNFPIKKIKNIEIHPVDYKMLSLLEEGGLAKYLAYQSITIPEEKQFRTNKISLASLENYSLMMLYKVRRFILHIIKR